MYKSKMSGFSLSVVMILAITLLCSITFGTLAYFRVQTTANGLITVGSDIEFSVCDSSGTAKNCTMELTDFSQNTKDVGFYVKKSAGVNAKVRVYVAVSIEDENGNLQNMLNGSNPIVTVNMGSSSNYKWVSEGTSQEQLVGAGWRYLKTADGSADYKVETSDSVIPVCPTITVNANSYAGLGYKLIVSLTVEMLQYDNASWN